MAKDLPPERVVRDGKGRYYLKFDYNDYLDEIATTFPGKVDGVHGAAADPNAAYDVSKGLPSIPSVDSHEIPLDNLRIQDLLRSPAMARKVLFVNESKKEFASYKLNRYGEVAVMRDALSTHTSGEAVTEGIIARIASETEALSPSERALLFGGEKSAFRQMVEIAKPEGGYTEANVSTALENLLRQLTLWRELPLESRNAAFEGKALISTPRRE
jgi:hypothetical protein